MSAPPSPRAAGTIVTDFDGTITLTDVGATLFATLTQGAAAGVVASWKEGAFGSRECLIRECALARGSRADLLRIARAQPVDPGFVPFVRSAQALGWRVVVASDGLETYITDALDRMGLSLEVRANLIRFVADRLVPSFPRAGRGCGACGNCKAGVIEESRSAGPVVFIGNGLSDRCAAPVADWVFAKDEFARFCDEQGTRFTRFETFSDVTQGWLNSAPND